MAKNKYVKCPRCDLNYMDSRQELCDVCKAELGMKSNFILEDDDMEMDDELTKLCPICKSVRINLDETMCDACAAAKANNDGIENDEEWRNFLDDDSDEFEDEGMEISLDEWQKEEEEIEEEEEEYEDIRDEFEDDFDDYADDYDEDYDDDEDDDYDDDDEDDDEEDDEEAPRRKSSRKKK